MRKKFLLSAFFVFMLPFAALCAENQDIANDYITSVQNEINADISNMAANIETVLSGMKLTSSDISRRIAELSVLSEKSSDDMAAWGYTDEQREAHERVLSELSVVYAAYDTLLNSSTPNIGNAASVDVVSLGAIESPDINDSDSLRQEITKVSRRLDVQVFYLQSKMNKLRADLAEAEALQKQLSDAESGNSQLELPRTHVLRLELARVNVALSQVQVHAQISAFDQNVSEIQRLRRRLASFQEKLVFTMDDLNENLTGIQERINELTTEMTNARKALDSANSALVRARAAMGSADVMPLTNVSSNYLARSARVTYWEYMLLLLEEGINLRREYQEIWRNRYKLFHDEVSGEEIWRLRDYAQTRINDLQRQLEGIRTLESNLLRSIDETDAQANAEGLSGTIKQNMIQAAENQRKIISDIMNRYESLIPNAIFLYQRLYNEANDNLSAVRIAEKVSSFSKETVMGFLNTELWQGEGYSVTVIKLTIAILVFLSSFFLSSLGSQWIKRKMIKRFKASVTAANAIQRIVFYILWVAFALIALNIVQIPLTAFAFLGGAFAVGLGFGMQNIFNNLISGFIVIFSRPFKVNDIIDVAGNQGTVGDIGSRSTTIKTWDGFDVILPNRYFLENSVTNWTKSDPKKREILKVSASYDADSREVEKILMEVVKQHSKVLKDPAPFVVFKNFGTDGLEFELYYWIELRVASGMKVSSDMRHHILSLFKQNGINIPYPQRDVHIIPPKVEERESEDTEKL